MIGELKAAKLFDAYRGKPAADREALAKTLVEVSRMAAAMGNRLAEMDINPVFVGAVGAGVVAADALVVLKWPKLPGDVGMKTLLLLLPQFKKDGLQNLRRNKLRCVLSVWWSRMRQLRWSRLFLLYCLGLLEWTV